MAPELADRSDIAQRYAALMGRWNSLMASEFVAWPSLRPQGRWDSSASKTTQTYAARHPPPQRRPHGLGPLADDQGGGHVLAQPSPLASGN
jgi:hypothetical protein